MGMFEVDPKGLRKLLAGRNHGLIINELAQNAFDEEGVTDLQIEIRPVPGKRQTQVMVSDNSPGGFSTLSDAWTLFAESYKKGNPLQRGRFDLGEKLVIALCKRAEIVTTTGAVRFENNKRTTLRRKRDVGTMVSLWIPTTIEQAQQLEDAVHMLRPPEGITITLNGERLSTDQPVETFNATLPTVNADDEGVLRPSARKTDVKVYEANGSGAWLYEMGIPVVQIQATWTLDVQQKVPLNLNRDNVSPAFLRKLYAHTLNSMADALPKEDAGADWVVQGTSAKEIEPEALSSVFDKSMGTKRVMFDPSDPEANMEAVSRGHTLVRGNQLSQGQRDNIRRMRKDGNDPLRPSGRMFPTPKPYSDDLFAPPADIIPPSKWTERQKKVVDMARFLFEEVVGDGSLSVTIVNTSNGFLAAYSKRGLSGGRLDLNVKKLGHRWFDDTSNGGLERVLDTILHEFGHHYSGNHLSMEYCNGLTRIGARLAVRVSPRKYRKYGYEVKS